MKVELNQISGDINVAVSLLVLHMGKVRHLGYSNQ